MLILHFQIFIITIWSITHTEEKAARIKRDEHVPELDVPTFRRDSVEYVPQSEALLDRSSAYTRLAEYGTKNLPLRAAVERVPTT